MAEGTSRRPQCLHDLKRENTELLIEKRAMESDIADKLKTIATVEKEKAELAA